MGCGLSVERVSPSYTNAGTVFERNFVVGDGVSFKNFSSTERDNRERNYQKLYF